MKRNLFRILIIAFAVFMICSYSLVAAQSTFDFDSQGEGLKLNAAGVGLYGLGTGNLDIVIDIGGEVSYAVLVWGGIFTEGDCTASNCGDSEMVFNGTPGGFSWSLFRRVLSVGSYGCSSISIV